VVNVIVAPNPKAAVLLVRKRQSLGDPWSFDVSFPGGMVKEGESLLQALLRETEEETGLPPNSQEVIALVSIDRPAIMPGVLVLAFLSILKRGRNSLRPDPAEIAEAFWAPIDEIKGPAKMYHPFKKRVVEAYLYSRYVIWGVAKRILESSLFTLRAMRKLSA